MFTDKKTIGAFLFSGIAALAFVVAPRSLAALYEGARLAAPNTSQEEVQADLAERTRNLAEQYGNRRFGTEENPVVEEDMEQDFERAMLRREQRMAPTPSATGDSPIMYMPSDESIMANVVSTPVAEDLPKLPGSGLGISAVVLALGASGALSGRRKMKRALA